MAQRIKLDLDSSDSLDYDRDVVIPTPDGKEARIRFTFRYRDRMALASLFDGYLARAKDGIEARQDMTSAEMAASALDDDVATVQDIATAWDLGIPFDADNIRKLCRRYAGAASAILTDYRVSLTQGRLGN